MSRTPRISGLDLIAALAKEGFQVVRIRGSHHFGLVDRFVAQPH
jgi:predicted RNA binding protein YcfA (HicA-like mRNA interferase family)